MSFYLLNIDAKGLLFLTNVDRCIGKGKRVKGRRERSSRKEKELNRPQCLFIYNKQKGCVKL